MTSLYLFHMTSLSKFVRFARPVDLKLAGIGTSLYLIENMRTTDSDYIDHSY